MNIPSGKTALRISDLIKRDFLDEEAAEPPLHPKNLEVNSYVILRVLAAALTVKITDVPTSAAANFELE